MHYSKTAGHWFRNYFNFEKEDLTKEVAIENWEICHKLLEEYPSTEVNAFRMFYTADNQKEAVRDIGIQYRLFENTVWKMVKKLEREFANIKGI